LKLKVLICDDEYPSRLITRSYLDIYPVDTIEASTASEALKLIEEEKPDLMIIDYNLPDKTGLDVIREIRGRVPIKVIVLTSEGFTEEIEDEIKEMSEGYLVKPLIEQRLVEVIEKVTGVTISNGK
jgi:CheY-like chemotaxis protein